MISIIILLFCGCGTEKKEEQADTAPDGIPVQIVTPRFKYFQEVLTFPGVTEAPVSVSVGFMASGTVKKMNFEVGQKIKKGRILATLDKKLYESQLGIARSQVNLSRANLAQVTAGSRKQQKGMARAQMFQAEANYKHALQELKRYKAVYKLDAIPKQQYDSVRSQYEMAREQYKSAKEQYSLTLEGASREDREVARANVMTARSNLKQTQIQLSYTTLYSPMDGIISRKLVEPGTVVNEGTPVYKIKSSGSLDIVIFIPSIHINKFFINQPAEIVFSELPGKIIKGRIYEIQPVSDASTRSYRVKLRLSSTPITHNYSGYIGNVVFRIGDKSKAAFVPVSALQKKSMDGSFIVYQIDGNKLASMVKVEVLRVINENAMISGDFKKDARIVVSGQEFLKEGARVHIVSTLNSLKFVTRDKEPPEDGILP